MTDNLFLFARIAGTPVAMPTEQIEAVVRLGEIIPVARTAPYVRGLAALRSRVLTVIDAKERIVGSATDLEGAPLAIITEVDGHNYALLIEAVSDIAAVHGGISPLRGQVEPAWEPFVQGMIVHDEHTFLALSTQCLARIQPLSAAA
jgi:purine-binding chemotaxis protein CheW